MNDILNIKLYMDCITEQRLEIGPMDST